MSKHVYQSINKLLLIAYLRNCNTSDRLIYAKQCRDQFNFTLLSVALERRRTKFMVANFLVFNLRGLGCGISLLHLQCTVIVFFIFVYCSMIIIFCYLMSNKYFQPVCYCGFSENQKQGQLKCPQTEGSLETYSFGDSTPAMAVLALKNVSAPPRRPVKSMGSLRNFSKGSK